MRANQFTVDIGTTPLISIDCADEFTQTTGAFYREFGRDAEPLIKLGERAKIYVGAIRREFGKRLRHVAVISEYRYAQFHEQQGWPPNEQHALDSLCVDPTYLHSSIEDSRLISQMIEKNANDATTSEGFMRCIKETRQAVLIGVTTTSCIEKTFASLLPMMKDRAIATEQLVIARDGFAARKSRQSDHERILDWLAEQDQVVVVPELSNITWRASPSSGVNTRETS